MCMTWGEIKAKMEDAGVTEDHEIEDICICHEDDTIRVIHEDGVVCVEGTVKEEASGHDHHDHDHDHNEDEWLPGQERTAAVEPEVTEEVVAEDKVEEPKAPTEGEGEVKAE